MFDGHLAHSGLHIHPDLAYLLFPFLNGKRSGIKYKTGVAVLHLDQCTGLTIMIAHRVIHSCIHIGGIALERAHRQLLCHDAPTDEPLRQKN
jgi:hypothetical protein